MKKYFIIQMMILLVGGSLCCWFSVPAGILLLITGILLLLTEYFRNREQKHNIIKLCDKITQILNGADTVQFNEFQEDEFSILSSEIHKMTIRLREQNSALSREKQFMKESLEDMSHQLRTPLTSMMLIAGMLRKQSLSPQEQIQKIQELMKLLSQMQWQIETLLKISRFDAGAVKFQKSEIRMADLIQNALAPVEISLELKNITVRKEITGEPSFTGDMPYCTEAVTNILKNCMEHTPENGIIQIRAFQNAIYTGLVITDSGAGIPEEDLPHLFERFYRGKEFSRNGFGLGLAFAQKIIVSQNGSLRASNAVPHGAEFEFRIYQNMQI